jgi:hypothetical protein
MRIQLPTLFLFLAVPALAAEPACPASIAVDETLTSGHEGWTVGRTDLLRRLSGITIFEGNPADMASLIGEQHKPGKATVVSTWQFTPGTQYWISCAYSGSRIVLSQPIPQSYHACVITYATDVSIDGAPEIRKVEWRR